MKNPIIETTRLSGVKVQLGQGGDTFIVQADYQDGSKRDTQFFGSFDSAMTCFNEIVEQGNAIALKKGGE